MEKLSIRDIASTFDALILSTPKPTHLVLFAAGAGGNPERHLPLLNSISENGCTVIAPYFERLMSLTPSSADLALRARRLRLALDTVADPSLSTIGIGHSIGATLLLAMAGAEMWMRSGERVAVEADQRIKKVVLFTPPTGFFQAPRALEAVRIPVQSWSGSVDSITPQAQIEFLRDHLPKQVPLDLRIVDGAGHFSFMNTLPPQISDPMVGREAFLRSLAIEVCRFTVA